MTLQEQKKALENGWFYTPRNAEEHKRVCEALDYHRKVGDGTGTMIAMQQLMQGNQYAALVRAEGGTY